MFENLKYVSGVRTALKDCMKVKEGEEVLIVGDTDSLEITNAFVSIASSLGAEASAIIMKSRETHGNEPTKTVELAMEGAEVVMIPTSTSLSHTNAREKATQSGARIASMPGITKEILEKGLDANYQTIAKKSEKIANEITNASKAEIKTEKGTNLTLNIEGREGLPDTGILSESKDFGNLPAGEAYCAPVENEGEGTIVVDVAMAGIGKLSSRIELEIENGEITDINGDAEAKKLKELLKSGDENSWKVAELGIGTNEEAVPMGNILIDEKLGSTVHVAFGDNSHMGGVQESQTHLDGIISDPTLKLDEKIILKNGEWKI